VGTPRGTPCLSNSACPLRTITGEEGAEGTSDAIVFTPDELIVIDLKYGRGVYVSAAENEQGMLYALGALELIALLGDEPSRVRIVIHQPRVSEEPSEWTCSIELLRQFGEHVAVQAKKCFDSAPHLSPGEKQCRFCKAKAGCPALAKHVLSTVADDFVDLTVVPKITTSRTYDNETLANLRGIVDLVEDWCKAIRTGVEKELRDGHEVPGYKLVEGRKGPRSWTDETEVGAAMKTMGLTQGQMYTYNLISPTSAEKLFQDNPRKWKKLQSFITQNNGKPHVAPISDPRPVITALDDFSIIED